MNKSYQLVDQLVANVEKVIVGKRTVIQKILAAFLVKGHILLEDVPGVGKTMMVRALAHSIGCSFKRIQFTPDLLPTDVLGVSIYNPKTMEFEFRAGPVMTNILLADEINRTSPKSQAALLECMAESTVTVDGTTYPLAQPFLVMATQNPIEYEGTFPLPEAQLDRFMLKLKLGYPQKEEEMRILSPNAGMQAIEELAPVCTTAELIQLQHQVLEVHTDEMIKEYIIDICQRTRSHRDILLGVSPRGAMGLFKLTKAWAFIQHREFVTPDDIKRMVPDALGHRMILNPDARMEGKQASGILEEIMQEISVPVDRRK
jgi:MoxR-like ATPase